MQPIRLIAISLLLLASPCFAFDLQGHRGARGLAPENTLVAFQRALEIGVDTLELDIGLTSDGMVAISHDIFLNPAIVRDAGGKWITGAKEGPLIHSLTWAQLQTYQLGRIDPASPYAATLPEQQPHDGLHFPSLASLFEMTRTLGADTVRFNIETKIDPGRAADTAGPEEMTNALLAVIRKAGMEKRVTIQSFDWRSLQLVQKLAPSITTVYLTLQTQNADTTKDGAWTAGLKFADYGSAPKMVKASGGTVWSPNGGAVTEALVQEAHTLGLTVIPWTINNPVEMDKLIDWGVDGLISDYPHRLREVMRARGMPLPQGLKN